jgi:hypothetical protein
MAAWKLVKRANYAAARRRFGEDCVFDMSIAGDRK